MRYECLDGGGLGGLIPINPRPGAATGSAAGISDAARQSAMLDLPPLFNAILGGVCGIQNAATPGLITNPVHGLPVGLPMEAPKIPPQAGISC